MTFCQNNAQMTFFATSLWQGKDSSVECTYCPLFFCLSVYPPIVHPSVRESYCNFHSLFNLLGLVAENKGVWDFAGDGWVHRLVLHQSDPVPVPTPDPNTSGDWQSGSGAGSSPPRLNASHRDQASSASSSSSSSSSNNSSSSSSSNRGEVSVKIVEIADPRSHATHRPRTAPLSEQQEEMAVNRSVL